MRACGCVCVCFIFIFIFRSLLSVSAFSTVLIIPGVAFFLFIISGSFGCCLFVDGGGGYDKMVGCGICENAGWLAGWLVGWLPGLLVVFRSCWRYSDSVDRHCWYFCLMMDAL